MSVTVTGQKRHLDLNSSTLTTTGNITAGGNIILGDGQYIHLGDNPDLKIYHNGSHSFIQDTGAGDLRLLGSSIKLQSTTEENMLVATPNGAVALYHDNSVRFETGAAGAQVTGSFYLTTGNFVHFDNGVTNNYAIRKQGTTLEFKTGGSYNFLSGDADFAGHLKLSAGKALRLYNTAGNAWAEVAFNESDNLLQVQRGIVASSDSALNLGTNTVRWANVYADTLHGDGSNITGVTATDSSKVAKAGDTMTGGLTITHADGLFVKHPTNGGVAQIKFSDAATGSYDQVGHIKYAHGNAASYGSGESFVIGGTETSMTILADGKLMYNEGIYSKPGSGTGAGTRKDANWDAAYTHSQSAHAPSDADATPSWVPSSDPGYLTSSSTQSKYLRSDEADTATGKITFSTNAATIALAGTNHTYAEFYKTGTGNGRSAYLGFGSSGNNHFNIANEISSGKVIIDTNGGSVEINDNTTVSGALTVTGDLNITGDINSYNVTDLDVVDKTITIGKGQTEANSGGSGIIVDGASASILWDESNSLFDFNKNINIETGSIALGGDVSLFRDGANILRTDDAFHANSNVHVGGAGRLYDRADTDNYIELADTIQVSTDTKISGNLTVGPSATTGGRILSQTYTSADRLGVISSHASSGNLLIGYGAEGKTSASGDFVSTYGNFSGGHSALSVSGTHLRWYSEASNSTTAVGNDLTLANVFSVDRSGNVALSGTVDGVDIATRDGVLTTTTNTANAALPKAGGSMTGNITFGSQYGVRFNDANTRIYTNTDSPEDLLIEADQDLWLSPDGDIRIGDDVNVIYDNISTGNSGTVVYGGFLNPASEVNMVHIPHIVNDLAGFDKWSNATITTSGFYGTRSGSSGSYTYSNEIANDNSGWAKAFDAHSSTAGSWYSDNGSDGIYQHGTDTPGVVELEWTNEATYSLWAGIVFGSASFTATYVKIEAYRGGAWQTLCEITDNTDTVVLRQVANNSGTNAATTKLKYTLGGSVNNSYFRIHSLYMANYRAGDNNLNNTGTDTTRGVNFLERYKDGYLYGHLRPGKDDTYDLGSSSYEWKDGYFDGTVYSDALNVSGNITVSGTVDGVDVAALAAANTGTNTGDQDLSGYVTLAGAQTISGNKTFSVQPTFNADTIHNGHIYGRAVNNESSRLYRFGGLWLTWDSDSYGTNFNHSITSTDNGTYSDSITINSYDKVRINIDSNNNDSASTFSVGKHGTGTSGTLLTLEEDGDLTVTGALSGSNFSGSSSGTNTGDQVSSDFTHDDLTGYVANEHIDWTAENAGTIHASNFSDSNTFRTIKVDTNNDGTVDATLGATENLALIGGTAITLSESGGVVTINGTAETYTAHENISAASSVDNSGNTFIQDITLDSNGHVTFITSAGVSIPEHDNLTGYVANEHIDWTVDASTDIHANNIPDLSGTYLTSLSGAVLTSGAQTVAGTKTFSSAIIANGGVAIQDISDTTITRHSAGHIETPLYRIFDDGYHPNADTLTTARTIAGTSFDGSANIDISYDNLTNKPTIPTNNNQLTNGAGYITSFDITTQTDPKYIRSNADDTVSAHTEWQDSKQARFGNDSDLYIQHTGSEGQIFNSTGQLDIRSSTRILLTSSAGENMAKFHNDGAVELYYNNSQKFATTSSGVSVTGTVQASGNIGNKGTNIGQVLEYGTSSVATLRFDSDRWRIYSGGSGGAGERFSVLETGNVGVGDSTPSYKLDVAGTIRATGDVIAYSDERVKENIKTIDNSLEKVNKLRGVEFNKIGEDKKSIGVIAQEIEKILPEVVRTDDEGMKSVAYGNVVGVLIEAVKELTKEVEELKKCNKCKNCNCNA